MIRVYTDIEIKAPIETCFDMARNIDVHTQTVWSHTKERAVAGRSTGMINDRETVTFQARHFLIRQKHTSIIKDFTRPYKFVDEMVSGTFKSMRHEHDFIETENGTLMKDTLYFEAPLGLLGWIVERIVLKSYMKRFLEHRNHNLKRIIEEQA
ncbi:SRPBCC family protein [Paenibacillus sp. N1-5-1-14]|uniref:SRPBCC family protein n=1 Tax=Paenibacillus radicibacter TaxID=2972488 RepID=UPI0021599BDC|nr:SRPBCC family protein [Paenibacillus radicibacter]MCR8642014.1 SRPBCC family protein [Paenibacillus radicibacter]